MNIDTPQYGWYAVARSKDLKRKKPLKIVLFGIPLVLFGSPKVPRILRDQCPHRGAALSEGRKIGEKIECPYHGWRFDGLGNLTEMPCLIGDLPHIKAQPFEVSIAMGLVFVKIGDVDGLPYKNPYAEKIKFWRPMPGGANTTLVDAAENFLDITHTMVVHKNILRSSKHQTPTRVIGSAKGNEALVQYYGEGDAGGVVSALLHERDRVVSVGRFVGPNIAEVEFHGPKGPNFIMTGYLTPIDENNVGGFGMLGLPGPKWWAWLKYLILYPFIHLVHNQDKKILASVNRNRKIGGKFRDVIGPLDFIRPQIDAIILGKTPPAQQAPFESEINL
ncbi:MAG: Rieske 2Fe-2S domain-containing protein [Litorimonas sp.]